MPRAEAQLRVSSAGGHGLPCSRDPLGSPTRQAAGPGVALASRKLAADRPWAFHLQKVPDSTGRRRLAPCVTPPPSRSSSHGRGSGKAQAARGEEGEAGHRAAQGVPDSRRPPAPGPFFPLLFVRDLLIGEQGPFMWRWASPVLPVPPMAGDFLFIWS